jgi:N-acylneuraminate cytidylyltransferase
MTSGAVVVIPARGGSTRIPGKNIKAFNRKPMIAWPILAARESAEVSSVVVSTDAEEIGDLARKLGASVPFVRPVHLADDHAGTAPVILHALDALELTDDVLVVCLYPTAAVTTTLIDSVIQRAIAHPEDFVVTVGRHRSPFERSLLKQADGKMALEDDGALLSRTQDLPERFFDAGKAYAASVKVWRERETMMSQPFVPLLLPDWASVDIDEPDDWAVAEALHRSFVLEGR